MISTPPPQPGRCSLTLALARHPSPNAEQVYELFSRCGEVKRVIMGLDRYQKTPCGFCFVEFYHRENTEDALRLISGCKLDERIIRVGEALAPRTCVRPLPLPRRRRRCSRCASCAASLAQTGTAALSKGGSMGGAARVGRFPRSPRPCPQASTLPPSLDT